MVQRIRLSTRAKSFAQPPSRNGCTFTHTLPCHSLSSKVPRRPGIRRCQCRLPVRPASSRSLWTTSPRPRHSSRACSAVNCMSIASIGSFRSYPGCRRSTSRSEGVGPGPGFGCEPAAGPTLQIIDVVAAYRPGAIRLNSGWPGSLPPTGDRPRLASRPAAWQAFPSSTWTTF